MAYPVRFYRVSPSYKKRGQNLTPELFYRVAPTPTDFRVPQFSKIGRNPDFLFKETTAKLEL